MNETEQRERLAANMEAGNAFDDIVKYIEGRVDGLPEQQREDVYGMIGEHFSDYRPFEELVDPESIITVNENQDADFASCESEPETADE